MQGATKKSTWLHAVSAYTLGGAFTSLLVGGALASIGGFVPMRGDMAVARAGVGVGVVCLWWGSARGRGYLPQFRRQTDGTLAKRARPQVAALFWGLDIGLAFSTWLTFPGVWLVAALAFGSSSLLIGCSLFLAFWIGRAASVWTVPLLVRDPRDQIALLRALNFQRPVLERMHRIGIGLAIGYSAALMLI